MIAPNSVLALPKAPMLIAGFSPYVSGVGAKIAVYNINYDGQKFTGQVLNSTSQTVHYVKVNYEAINPQGSLVDVGSVYIAETSLGSRLNGTFSGVTQTAGTNLIIKSVEWLDNTDGLGTCNIPGETASNGSQCGGRAASERVGGAI